MTVALAALLALVWFLLAFASSTWTGTDQSPAALLPSGNDTALAVLGNFEFVRGILGMAVRSIALAGIALIVAARFPPRFGRLAIVFGLASLAYWAMSSFNATTLVTQTVPAIAAGFAGDFLTISPRPFGGSSWRLVAFGSAVPLVFWTLHLSLVAATSHGLWWPMYAFAGAGIYASLGSALLAALVATVRRQPSNAVASPMPFAKLNWAFSIAALWFGLGVTLDGWAHNHLGIVDAFFAQFHRTPSITPLDHEMLHSVLYLGYLGMAVIVVRACIVNAPHGTRWYAAAPPGYGPALVGVAVFLIGGIGDLLWHLAFGVESSAWALVSPPHLMLIVGASLAMLAPVRAALIRGGDASLRERMPALLSFMGFLGGLAFFTMLAYSAFATVGEAPAAILPGTSGSVLDLFASFDFARGALSVLVRSVLIAGIALFIAARFRPRFGSLTLTVGALGVAAMTMIYLPDIGKTLLEVAPFIVAGLFADLLNAKMLPFDGAMRRVQLFGFIVPFVYWVLALGLDAATAGGLWWSPAAVAGVILCSGLAGLFVATTITATSSPAKS